MPSATSRSGEKKGGGGGDAFDKRSTKHAAAAASVSTNASSDPSGDASTITYPHGQGQSSDTQHAADIARATQNSLTDAVGAFSVAGPGFRAANANANDSTNNTSMNNITAGSSTGYNGSSAAAHASGHASGHVHNYSADNLPPNIDIIAEATLVHPENEDDYDYEEDSNVDTLGLRNDVEANLGGAHPDSASVAVSAITSPYIPSVAGGNNGEEEVHSAHCESAPVSEVVAGTSGSRPGRNQVGSSTQPTTGTGSTGGTGESGTGGGTSGGGDNANSSPVEAVEAIAMDKRTLYACGTHLTLQTWHWALLVVAILACVAIPVGVVYGTKNNSSAEPDQSFDWTPELITSIVSPSVSGPGSFLPWEVLTEDGRELGNPQARAIEWLANGGADIITGPSLEAVEWRVQQRYILAVLYYSTGGETWKNQYGYLDNDTHECEWGGMLNNGWKSMDCTGGDGRVTLINLWQNDLRGTLPKELASLSDSLTALDLLTNQIGGTLPDELFALKKLTYLNLGYNQFQGTVSSALGELDQLTYLMLDNNDLTGTIPPELGKLTQLSGWLSLEGNRLHGTVPETFKDLTLATWIYVNYNDLEGSLEFLCEALTPVEAPGGVNANSGSPLLELWADIGEVECSCCNCCPFVEGTAEGVGEATGEEEEEGGAAGPYYVNEVVELEGTGEEGDATEGEGATEGTEEVAVEDGAATEDEGAGEEGT